MLDFTLLILLCLLNCCLGLLPSIFSSLIKLAFIPFPPALIETIGSFNETSRCIVLCVCVLSGFYVRVLVTKGQREIHGIESQTNVLVTLIPVTFPQYRGFIAKPSTSN